MPNPTQFDAVAEIRRIDDNYNKLTKKLTNDFKVVGGQVQQLDELVQGIAQIADEELSTLQSQSAAAVRTASTSTGQAQKASQAAQDAMDLAAEIKAEFQTHKAAYDTFVMAALAARREHTRQIKVMQAQIDELQNIVTAMKRG